MVKTRIKQFCEAEGITVSSFEKSIGASNGYVNSISRSVGIDKLNRILEKYPYLNIEWLLTGNGDMKKQQEQHEVPNTIDIHQLINTIAEQAKEIGRLEQALEDAKREKGLACIRCPHRGYCRCRLTPTIRIGTKPKDAGM